MKTDQKGFSVVETLIVIVIVGLIGAVGWLVYDRQKSSKQQSSSQQDTENQAETKLDGDCDATYKENKNEKLSISFCYPETWGVELMDYEGGPGIGLITLKSPDYVPVESGFGGSNTGSAVYISVTEIVQRDASYATVSNILDGTEQSKQGFTEVRKTKIAGIDGATFISGYEGPQSLTNMFENKGKEYSIRLEEDVDGPKFNDNQDEYQKIVTSFKLLRQ